MAKKLPPPPGWTRRQVPGEDDLVRKWMPRVEYHAGRVRTSAARRLGMDRDDVVQDLMTCLLTMIRTHTWYRGQPPGPPSGRDGALLTTVLRRRVSVLNRDGGVWFRALDDQARSGWTDGDLPSVTDRVADYSASSAEDQAIQQDFDDACRALVYAVQANVPPAAFAILHLRVIEELEPAEIAELIGVEGGTKVSKRLGYAKRIASDFLKSIGIQTWDAVRATAEDEHG